MTDRFDRFTERARKTLQLAQEEAQRFNHNYIGTEHILLGLVSEGDGVAARVLTGMGVELNQVRSAVEFIIGRGDHLVMGEIGLTPRAKRVIELAVDEARRLNHHYIGTEHLLLGLVREGEGIAAGVLESLGVSLEKVRAQVIEVLKSPSGYSGTPRQGDEGDIPINDRFQRFTGGARKTLQFAQEEAQRFNHNYIDTEHILLGLVREGNGVAARVLTSLGIELNKVRSAVEFIIGRGDRMVMGEIGLTPRAKRVIELAVDEAHRLNHHYIGTEHLLLGLIQDGDSRTAGVVENLGASLEQVRAKVIEVLVAQAKDLPGTFPPGRPTGRPQPAVLMLRTLFEYSIWARDQLLPLIEGLEDDQRKKGDNKGVYGSIHDTLAHMAQSEWLWIERCKGESPMRLPKGEDFPTLTALIDWWNDVHKEAMQYLDTLTEHYLGKDVTYTAPDGIERTRQIWHMLLQVPNHQTEHRSQIASMLGAMGLEVPPTDLVVYLSKQSNPS